MTSVFLSRAICALCLSGMALGMSAVGAQETSAISLHVGDGGRWIENIVANSDPESEVNNGMKPKNHIDGNSESEVDNEPDSEMENYNYPETEVGNGTSPPRVNP